MKRKVKGEKIRINDINIPVYSANTLIIGSGAAALNAAVSLVDLGQENIIIATDQWGAGTSNNAGSDKQTYYKLSLEGRVPDSAREMAADLFEGGCMHGDIALCEAHHSIQAFYRLVQLGVPFPHDRFGAFIGYKTDHDPRGRGTSAGPLTSKMMFQALEKEVLRKNIPVFDKHEVIALLTGREGENKYVAGALALDKKNLNSPGKGMVVFNSVNVILGTGGPAGIYKTSVYPESQSGSTGLALKIGAKAHNLTESQFGLASVKFRWNLSGSYQQVIPRYISTSREGKDEKEFLNDFFPDAGTLGTAIFLKGYQWPFDPRKIRNYGSSLIDLLVYRETVEKRRRAFLDFTGNPRGLDSENGFRNDLLGNEAGDYLKRSGALSATPVGRLKALNQPAVDLYMDQGIDLESDLLEIAVCAQHNNGGLLGNHWWESNIKHLFPVGEVNGTHGVYRPGGSALNAGQVGGLRSAIYISRKYNAFPPDLTDFLSNTKDQIVRYLEKCHAFFIPPVIEKYKPEFWIEEIRERMTNTLGIVRKRDAIERALEEARKTYHAVNTRMRISSPDQLPAAFKTLDHSIVHLFFLEAACEYLNRGGKSRGSFFVPDRQGEKASEKLGEEWQFLLSGKNDFTNKFILEIWLNDAGSLMKKWIEPRPVPDREQWFETVWKDFRDGKIIE
ncbi:MAG: FAD-binding protein [Bacteroidales bacterium]|nr:MAG: FAD-binding protein [Bacteroidales bacterium]